MTDLASSDALAKYREKRDFAKTAEPEGKIAKAGGNRFVVQKHAASRLHYDLRLELDGVLKSWAVTRGPSSNPDDKRLAVRTEDHPVEYATFEGTIPNSEYGGGTMMLWDTGTWEPLAGKDPSKTLPEGHLHFFLQGHRLKGEWMLFRLKPRGKEKGENWILRKVTDDQVGGSEDLVGTHLTGMVSGLTMEQIASGERGKSRAPATPTAKPATKAAKARATGRKKVRLTPAIPTCPARDACRSCARRQRLAARDEI
jgi:bifunctional non-homologous end joining protein LigD